MTKEQIETYKEFVRFYYTKRDPAYDFRHIERIISCLDLLSEGGLLPPRHARLYFLACFHVRDDEQFREQVRTFLHNLEWTDAEIEKAFRSLECRLMTPRAVEEDIVHDANYIETLGAFGIAKAFTTGGARGQSYEKTADIFEYRYLAK